MNTRDPQLSALLISPHHEIAEQFLQSVVTARAFQIIGELRVYPGATALDTRLRQLRPDVVLLDLVSDPQLAGELVQMISSHHLSPHVVGLCLQSDSRAIVGSLRLGASEFLCAPFSADSQREVAAKLRRLRQPEPDIEVELGKVVVFASTKPGSGASTLASQTAFTLQRLTGRRILLADFDLISGLAGFTLKLTSPYSLLDALEHADHLDHTLWSSFTVTSRGLDVMLAPETSFTGPVEQARLHEVLQYARRLYDWVIVDLPSIFHQVSLVSLSESDRGFLISTPELSSLHLTRKAITMLGQLGLEPGRYEIILNRTTKRDQFVGSDLAKLFSRPVHSTTPEDSVPLHRALTLGQPLEGASSLGRAIHSLAAELGGVGTGERRRTAAFAAERTNLARTPA